MQLARAIKANPAISATRLILLSSVGKRGEGEEARMAGIKSCLTKPVRQSELYHTIATVMGASAGAEMPREKQLVTRYSLREKRARLLPRVLLAEDNPVNQKVATVMLEKLGYRVDVAVNGVEALEALSQSSYAMVLMDVQMPEMDGYEATAEIRRREEPVDRHTPIIAMTANAMQGDREKALESGMDDYLSKPVKREELSEVLKRWMQRGTSKEVGTPDETEAPATDDSTPLATSANAVAQKEEDSQNPLDESVLEGLRALGDASLLAELVELFVDEAPSRLMALRNAVEDEDAGTVEQTAHTLKGSCSNMGAWRMANLCAELQELGSSGELTATSELLDQLQAEFDRVRATLEEQTR
jgi:CheY-like chemotaxis protein/HPt (histidine-containing phosphotransfer) domain-containing protein